MSYRGFKTIEARQRHNKYNVEYRRRNPDRVRKWRDNYALKRAELLLAAQSEQMSSVGGGDSDARD